LPVDPATAAFGPALPPLATKDRHPIKRSDRECNSQPAQGLHRMCRRRRRIDPCVGARRERCASQSSFSHRDTEHTETFQFVTATFWRTLLVI
jgi:hypothetical protein